MLTVTEEAVAFLIMAEGRETRHWMVRDYGRPGDPNLAVWREDTAPGTLVLTAPPTPTGAKREIHHFRERLEAAFFIRQMALKAALQALFDSPDLPTLLPMAPDDEQT